MSENLAAPQNTALKTPIRTDCLFSPFILPAFAGHIFSVPFDALLEQGLCSEGVAMAQLRGFTQPQDLALHFTLAFPACLGLI